MSARLFNDIQFEVATYFRFVCIVLDIDAGCVDNLA